MWLLRKIENAQLSVDLILPELQLGHPLGANHSWFDTLNDLLIRNCAVNLYLKRLPANNSEDLSISRQIQVLVNKGMKIWEVNEIPLWQIIIDTASTTNKRAIRSLTNESIVLGNDIATKQLVTTISERGIISSCEDLRGVNKRLVDITQFDPPPNTKVINIHSVPNQYITVPELFSEVFNKPCRSMLVNDPYLLDRRSIYLLHPYMEMASSNSTLQSVVVHTKKSNISHEQSDAEKSIKAKFGNIIVFKHEPLEHDRYIEITRVDGEKARIIFGRGLDFMQLDGSIKSTFIIIQDPITS